jgi:hypothetical protein
MPHIKKSAVVRGVLLPLCAFYETHIGNPPLPPPPPPELFTVDKG